MSTTTPLPALSRLSPAAAALSRRRLLQLGGAGAVGAAVVGCSVDPDGGADVPLEDLREGAMDDFAAGTAFRATTPLEFDTLFCDWPEHPYQEDWTFFDEVAAMTNVTLNVSTVPFSDHTAKRGLLVSAGDAPTMLPLTYAGEELPYVSSGAILPVSDYLDLMPNYTAKVEQWGLAEEVDGLRQADGKYYLLAGLQETPRPDFTMVVREDVFEEQGIALPQTWDEFREALVTLKQAYPDVTPFSDRFQGNSSLSYAAAAFGTEAGWGYGTGAFFDHDAGEFVYTGTSPAYRELVTYFAGLVSDGLMDPESYTQELEPHDRKVATSACFAMTGNSTDIVTWTAGLNETLGEGNFKVTKIAPPAGPAGPMIGGGRLWHGVMLRADVRERPDFVALMQFIDYLFYDDAAKEFCRWGVEGEMFTRDEAGDRRLTEGYSLVSAGLNTGGETDLLLDLGFTHGIYADSGASELMLSMVDEVERSWVEETLASRELVRPTPPAPLSELEREQASLQATPLTDSVSSNTLRFILGQRDLSEWDAYVAEVQGQGATDYIALVQSAYERFNA